MMNSSATAWRNHSGGKATSFGTCIPGNNQLCDEQIRITNLLFPHSPFIWSLRNILNRHLLLSHRPPWMVEMEPNEIDLGIYMWGYSTAKEQQYFYLHHLKHACCIFCWNEWPALSNRVKKNWLLHCSLYSYENSFIRLFRWQRFALSALFYVPLEDMVSSALPQMPETFVWTAFFRGCICAEP